MGEGPDANTSLAENALRPDPAAATPTPIRAHSALPIYAHRSASTLPVRPHSNQDIEALHSFFQSSSPIYSDASVHILAT